MKHSKTFVGILLLMFWMNSTFMVFGKKPHVREYPVELYEAYNYKGSFIGLKEGKHCIKNTDFDNKASSIYIVPGYEVKLYRWKDARENSENYTVTLKESVPNLKSVDGKNMNNKTSYLEIIKLDSADDKNETDQSGNDTENSNNTNTDTSTTNSNDQPDTNNSSPDNSGNKFPFPRNEKYADGSIMPSGSADTLNKQVTEFYDKWKERYVGSWKGNLNYVKFNGDNLKKEKISVSEGHGYGMIIMASMAGYDRNAKSLFDGMFRWFKKCPSTINKKLMSWLQLKEGPDGKQSDSATDGDLDIAYALLLADKQWGSSGEINYSQEAETLIAAIMESEINKKSWTPLLGDWVSPDDKKYGDSTRPSDFMVANFEAFMNFTGNKDWGKVVDGCYKVVTTIQEKHAKSSGLVSDFVVNTTGNIEPAPSGLLEESDPNYYYNSCRVPWRIGTGYLVSGSQKAKAILDKMNEFFKRSTQGNPEKLKSGYALSGEALPKSDYLSMAFLAPIGVSAMSGNDQEWLDKIWKKTVEQSLDNEQYFENTIKMICMIIMSGNWMTPDAKNP
ncbi:MAG: hypothetical protein HQM10_08185 [Candidatus Riflebacteria bacterium]|nr:hypothetical protein [Candidatus Riflebacteria bacterium]